MLEWDTVHAYDHDHNENLKNIETVYLLVHSSQQATLLPYKFPNINKA